MNYFLIISFLLLCLSCERPVQSSSTPNPAAEGFDEEGSDSLAMAIADEVMMAMGGRQAWDQVHYLQWTFLSGRKLTWDKWGERVRIEFPSGGLVLLTDLRSGQGRAFGAEGEITAPDSVALLMEMAKETWINDAYWLVMPFKLKDSGVTLTYVGQDSTTTGTPADVLQLTFREVGVTPQNKYCVWVGQDSKLIEQWAFYANAQDSVPGFITPWQAYEQHGPILLSGDRGTRERNGVEVPLLLPGIAVLDSVPEAFFLQVDLTNE